MSKPDRARFILATGALAVVLAAALVIEFAPRTDTPVIVETGKADVGGPFSLTDHTGKAVTERDLVGRPHIIYFGWTLDPDLTPAALQVLEAALQRVQPKSEVPARLFVSIDPQRDGSRQLAEVAVKYGLDLRAATAPAAAIEAMMRAYKMHAKQLPDPALPGGYTIEHSSLYYVMGRDGSFRGAVPHTTDAAELADALQRLLK